MLAELLKIGEEEARDDAVYEFFDAYAMQDPESAQRLRAVIGDSIDPETLAEIVEMANAYWVLENPATRLDPDTTEDGFGVFSEWLRQDPQAAVGWVEADGSDDRATKMQWLKEAAIGNFGNLPLEIAIEFADQWNAYSIRDGDSPRWARYLDDGKLAQFAEKFPLAAVGEIYRRDPERGMAMALAMDDDTLRERALRSALTQIRGSGERYQAFFAQVPADDRAGLAKVVLSAWARADPEAAFAASSEFPEAAAIVVGKWAESADIDKLYAITKAELGSNDLMLKKIVDVWAIRDPHGAGETLLADGLEQGLPGLISGWVVWDSVSASQFIRERLEQGEVRDEAVSELVEGIAAKDREAAREWAETIADPQRRASVIERLESPDPTP